MATNAAHADGDPFSQTAIAASLDAFIRFGVKHSGSEADNACGAWMQETLTRAGFATSRQVFETPYFTPSRCVLEFGADPVPLLPLAPVKPVDVDVSGPLAILPPGGGEIPRGAIVVAPLPFRRWSESKSPEVSAAIAAAARAQAAALLLITDGPTGEAVALNVAHDADWPLPVAILAPKQAGAVLAAAQQRQQAIVSLRGAAGRRPAFNVVGRLDRGAARTAVLSTPRSAWTIAAGERGPGVAVWRALAHWAPGALRGVNLVMVCNSGHEYENYGADKFLESADAPKPDVTHLWAHLGAGFAARDWHEFAGGRLAPLPSPDPQRIILASESLLPDLRAVFRGASGLEAPYGPQGGRTGETGHIIAAGYPRVFGLLGAHRYHHVAEDDARCVDAGHVAATAAKIKDAIRRLA
jgi:hypothetical protein